MALMHWKVVARLKRTKYNEVKVLWANNLKDVKKQLKKNGYKFVVDITNLVN